MYHHLNTNKNIIFNVGHGCWPTSQCCVTGLIIRWLFFFYPNVISSFVNNLLYRVWFIHGPSAFLLPCTMNINVALFWLWILHDIHCVQSFTQCIIIIEQDENLLQLARYEVVLLVLSWSGLYLFEESPNTVCHSM